MASKYANGGLYKVLTSKFRGERIVTVVLISKIPVNNNQNTLNQAKIGGSLCQKDPIFLHTASNFIAPVPLHLAYSILVFL